MVTVGRLNYSVNEWEYEDWVEGYEEWYEEPPTSENWLQPSPSLGKQDFSDEHSMIIESEILEHLHFLSLDFNFSGKIVGKNPQIESLEFRFYRLANEWKKETIHLSSLTKLVMHPKYQSIIGMGPDVLPILFRELQRKPDHWFWALKAITEEDPTLPEDAGNLQKMTEAWLNWAGERDYL